MKTFTLATLIFFAIAWQTPAVGQTLNSAQKQVLVTLFMSHLDQLEFADTSEIKSLPVQAPTVAALVAKQLMTKYFAKAPRAVAASSFEAFCDDEANGTPSDCQIGIDTGTYQTDEHNPNEVHQILKGDGDDREGDIYMMYHLTVQRTGTQFRLLSNKIHVESLP